MIHDIDSYVTAERVATSLTGAARNTDNPLRTCLTNMDISSSAFTDLIELALDAVIFRESMFSKLRNHHVLVEANPDEETKARAYRPMSRPDIFYTVSAFLRCYDTHLSLSPRKWEEIAWQHGLPMECPTEKISFCDWMLRIIGKPYSQMPRPVDETHDPYRILSSDARVRNFIYQYITEKRPSVWSLLSHIATNPVLEDTTPNLLTDWLYENPHAQESILSAMLKPSMTGGSTLNPFGVDALSVREQQTRNDQFLYLMRNAIPDHAEPVLVAKQDNAPIPDTDFSGTLDGLSSIWADNLDSLYFREMSRKEQHEKNLLDLDTYMPMLDSCYQNHTWTLSVENLSEEDRNLLESMYRDNDVLYVINRGPQTGDQFLGVPCTLTFAADGFTLSRPVWLYA